MILTACERENEAASRNALFFFIIFFFVFFPASKRLFQLRLGLEAMTLN